MIAERLRGQIVELPGCPAVRLLSGGIDERPGCRAARLRSGSLASGLLAKWLDCRMRLGGTVRRAGGRTDGRADGRTRGRRSGRAGGHAAGPAGDRACGRTGGMDRNCGGGPCAVIEGPELLVREVCTNRSWIAGRDHIEPHRGFECQGPGQRTSEGVLGGMLWKVHL